MSEMQIQEVAQLITRCWLYAENTLRELIRQKYKDRDEEIITTLFHGELEAVFEFVSSNGHVARALLNDLKNAFPKVKEHDLALLACDVVATVSFHRRELERVTGGDLGVVLVRPDFRQARYQDSRILIESDYKRGLLVQAKLLRRNGQWGGTSQNQIKALRGKLSYLAFLLYRYSDEPDRRELAPFDWQLAHNATIDEARSWFASDSFPSLQNSENVLAQLSLDQIGTDDNEIISKIIAPPTRASIEIRIHWRDGRDPGGSVYVELESDIHQAHQQHVIIQN